MGPEQPNANSQDGHDAGGNLPCVADDELVPESQEPDEEAHDSSSPSSARSAWSVGGAAQPPHGQLGQAEPYDHEPKDRPVLTRPREALAAAEVSQSLDRPEGAEAGQKQSHRVLHRVPGNGGERAAHDNPDDDYQEARQGGTSAGHQQAVRVVPGRR